jgi:hypothetical protein
MIREIYELVCFSNSSGTTVHKFTLSTTHNAFRCIFFFNVSNAEIEIAEKAPEFCSKISVNHRKYMYNVKHM